MNKIITSALFIASILSFANFSWADTAKTATNPTSVPASVALSPGGLIYVSGGSLVAELANQPERTLTRG